MVRRGQQGKRQLRRAKREVGAELGSARGAYERPDREECIEKRWEIPYDDANTVRVQFVLWRLGGRLADFLVNIQVIASTGWVTVEYFDCCHGHCHLHTNDYVETIQRLDSIDDLQRAFAQVERESSDRARIIRGSRGE